MLESLKLLDSIDYIIIGVLFLLNVVTWKTKISKILLVVVTLIFLGLVFPLSSSGREVDRNVAINGPAMDNFELFYTFFTFIPYWALMVLQFVVISFRPKYERAEVERDDILD